MVGIQVDHDNFLLVQTHNEGSALLVLGGQPLLRDHLPCLPVLEPDNVDVQQLVHDLVEDDLLIGTALDEVNPSPPDIRGVWLDAVEAHWAEPVGREHEVRVVRVYAENGRRASICLGPMADALGIYPIQDAREQVCQTSLVRPSFDDHVGLLLVGDVLQVHHVLRVLEDLRPQPAAVAEHAVALEYVVVAVEDSLLVVLEEVHAGNVHQEFRP
mmetsp:Transcript_5320/g.15358  ORF Transcript_5320/g.15358 Transcript_5320/m.15358 type:complete len:214 (+) Transcript_5320:223-864(+)